MDTCVTLRQTFLFLTWLCLVSTGSWASTVEMSLEQGFCEISTAFPSECPAGALDLTIRGAGQVDRADIRIDMGPFIAVYAVVLDRNPPVFAGIYQDDTVARLQIFRERTSAPDETDTLVVRLILISSPTESPLPYLGYQDCGFGEFTFLSVKLTDLQGQTIEDVTTIPGSWYYWTDAPAGIYIRVLRSDGITPIENARVKMTGLVGGAGISSVGQPTDSEGLTYVMYPVEWGFLMEPPNRTEPRTDVDLRAWFRVESAADTTVRFEPFDTLVELRVNEDRVWFTDLFEEVTIIVRAPSAVEEWGLYE